MRRVLITGSRNTKDFRPIREVFKKLEVQYGKNIVIVHGAQKSWDSRERRWYGVDFFADMLARAMGFQVEAHPADWNTHGKAAGPIRNNEMVKSRPDEGHAFHEDPGLGRGTKDCVRRMVIAEIPHEIHIIPVGEFQ